MTEAVTKDKRVYHVSVKYYTPMEGTVPLAAESIEDAREKALALFSNRHNVEIVNIYDAASVMMTEGDEDDDEDKGPSIN